MKLAGSVLNVKKTERLPLYDFMMYLSYNISHSKFVNYQEKK